MNEKTLYFRISRDGFMCKIPDGKSDVAVLHSDLKDLEQILQAAKKTQEKILNKQIQEIQDSKNLKSTLVITPTTKTNELQASIKEVHGILEDFDGNTKTFDETNLKNIELVFKSTNEILRSMGWPVEKINKKELEKIEYNQKVADKFSKRWKKNLAVVSGKIYPDDIKDVNSAEAHKILDRYESAEKENNLLKEILFEENIK